MASSKVALSSTSRNSDLRRKSSSSSASTKSSSISDLHNHGQRIKKSSSNLGSMVVETTLLDAEITLLDAAGAVTAISDNEANNGGVTQAASRLHSVTTSDETTTKKKTVDDVWKEIVAGRRECKKEAPDEMMTLEDFLAKAEAVEEEEERGVVKAEPAERLSGGLYAFDPMPLSPFPSLGLGNGVGMSGGKGKRRALLEPLDKAAQQRQRRMIKNRESAARSRERKQAYQVELESLAVKLEEENEKLLKEKHTIMCHRSKNSSSPRAVTDDPLFTLQAMQRQFERLHVVLGDVKNRLDYRDTTIRNLQGGADRRWRERAENKYENEGVGEVEKDLTSKGGLGIQRSEKCERRFGGYLGRDDEGKDLGSIKTNIPSFQVRIDLKTMFHTRCHVNGKVCNMLIDQKSCLNLASTTLVEKLKLPTLKHSHPYKLQGLKDYGEVRVDRQILVSFSIGKYHDEVLCDVVPMHIGHILLGKPWQYDRRVTHDKLSNIYSFVKEGKTIKLAPLTPSPVFEDQMKLKSEGAKKRESEKEIEQKKESEKEIEKKESESKNESEIEQEKKEEQQKSREVAQNKSVEPREQKEKESSQSNQSTCSLAISLQEFDVSEKTTISSDARESEVKRAFLLERPMNFLVYKDSCLHATNQSIPSLDVSLLQEFKKPLQNCALVRTLSRSRYITWQKAKFKEIVLLHGDFQWIVFTREVIVHKNLKSWEECLSLNKFVYTQTIQTVTSYAPLDLNPLSMHDRKNQTTTALVKSLPEQSHLHDVLVYNQDLNNPRAHCTYVFDELMCLMCLMCLIWLCMTKGIGRAEEKIEAIKARPMPKSARMASQVNNGQRSVTFDPGDWVWVWVHISQERSPAHRKTKLHSYGPFPILANFNDNADQVDFSGKYTMLATVHVPNHFPFDTGTDSRSNPFEERENDVIRYGLSNDGNQGGLQSTWTSLAKAQHFHMGLRDMGLDEEELAHPTWNKIMGCILLDPTLQDGLEDEEAMFLHLVQAIT